MLSTKKETRLNFDLVSFFADNYCVPQFKIFSNFAYTNTQILLTYATLNFWTHFLVKYLNFLNNYV